MLSTSLSINSSSNDLLSTLSTASTQASTAQTASATTQTQAQEDTVKISQAAQERLLYKQGESVSTIASTLGTTAKAVNEDLGLTLEKEIAQTLQATQASAK
jgi:NADH:ubiquinone oxidoreductase subunit E